MSATPHPPSPLSPRRGEGGPEGRRALLASGLVLLFLLAVELASTVHLSVTYDEPGHLRYGRQLLGGDSSRFDDSKMPVSALGALPGFVASRLPPGRLHAALATRFAARVPTMLASLALAALVWRWSRRLWGEAGGLLSLLLCCLDPNLIAHGRLVTTDLWAALAFTLVLFFAWGFAERPTVSRGLACALALGAAQAVKYSAVLLVPILALLALVRFWPEALAAVRGWGRVEGAERALLRRRTTLAAAWIATFALVGLLVVDAAFLGRGTLTRFGDYRFRSQTLRGAQERWPALSGVPVPVPYPWLEGLDWVHHRERTGEGYGATYLRGERRENGGFRGYYLWVWLYKLPLPTIALLLAALLVAWRRRARLRLRQDLAFLLLPPLLLALHLNLFFGAQMGVRYSLMVFPPLYVLAGVLLGEGVPPARHPRRARFALLGAVGWLAASVASWHPFYLSYVNELVPRRAEAWRLLADSNLDWGQSDWYLRRFLRTHPGAALEPWPPRPGLLVVRVNFLTGVLGDDRYAWLRRLRPVGQVGYSYIVFDVRARDLPSVPALGARTAR